MIEICRADKDQKGVQYAENILQNIEEYLDKNLMRRMEYRIERLIARTKLQEVINMSNQMYKEAYGQQAKHKSLWYIVKAAIKTNQKDMARKALLTLRLDPIDKKEKREIKKREIATDEWQPPVKLFIFSLLNFLISQSLSYDCHFSARPALQSIINDEIISCCYHISVLIPAVPFICSC